MIEYTISQTATYAASNAAMGESVLVQLRRDSQQVRVAMTRAQARHFAGLIPAAADTAESKLSQALASKTLRGVVGSVVRDALADVEVHPCDYNNELVRSRELRPPMAALYAALQAPVKEPVAAPQAAKPRLEAA